MGFNPYAGRNLDNALGGQPTRMRGPWVYRVGCGARRRPARGLGADAPGPAAESLPDSPRGVTGGVMVYVNSGVEAADDVSVRFFANCRPPNGDPSAHILPSVQVQRPDMFVSSDHAHQPSFQVRVCQVCAGTGSDADINRQVAQIGVLVRFAHGNRFVSWTCRNCSKFKRPCLAGPSKRPWAPGCGGPRKRAKAQPPGASAGCGSEPMVGMSWD